VAEFEISLKGLKKTTIDLRVASVRARIWIRDLLDTSSTSLPRPPVPRQCKADIEMPWAETHSESGGYAPSSSERGGRLVPRPVGLYALVRNACSQDGCRPLLAGIYEITSELHGKLIVADLANSFSAFSYPEPVESSLCWMSVSYSLCVLPSICCSGNAVYTCIREFVGSNLDQGTNNSDEKFHCFPQSFHVISNSLFISPNIRPYVLYIQSVPGGKVNILGGHSIGLSKQEEFICTYVLFRRVSEIELFRCTVRKLLIRKRYYVLFLIPVFIVQVTKLVQFT
jgi:hypothetical protein